MAIPTSGFEDNENSENAMYRELYEEIGLKHSDVLILGKTKDWLKYDLPKNTKEKQIINYVLVKSKYGFY